MFDDDESHSHSWLIVNISILSILMNLWISYHLFFSICLSFDLTLFCILSDFLSILNLIFYFLNCAIYYIWFKNRFKSIIFFLYLKNNAFALSNQNNYLFWQFYSNYNFVWFILKKRNVEEKNMLKIYKIDRSRTTINISKFVFSIITTASLFFFLA